MSSDLIEIFHDERLDQSETLSFTIPAGSSKAYLIAVGRELEWRGRTFYVAEVEEQRRGSEVTVSVECEALWYRLGQSVYVGSLILDDVTPADGLETILAGTGWTVGTATTTSSDVFYLEQQDKSRLAILREWARITGRFLVFNTGTRTVDLVDSRGRDLGLGFRYRRNVRSIRRRARPPQVTRIYPYGADGLTVAGINGGLEYVEDLSYFTDQGIPEATARELYGRDEVWYASSIVSDVTLLAAATARLAELSDPVISYELDVVDLSELTNIAEDIRPGDVVRVQDPDFGHDVRTTVVRYVRHPKDPKRNRVELSYLPSTLRDSTTSSSRPGSVEEWQQFVGRVAGSYEIRNDGTYTVARIPLRFREGGRANYHLDLFATGVGAGTMHVEVLEAVSSLAVFRTLDVPYTDGATVRATLSWAAEELSGQTDYRVRVSTTADGGPSPTAGVDIAEDAETEASWWILAQGAVRETPTAANSQRFDYVSNAAQQFTVPDNVTEVVIEAVGARGGSGNGGPGGRVTARFPVTPGQVLDVYAPSAGGGGNSTPGWPGGGQGGNLNGAPFGYGGGGYAAVIPAGGTLIDALLVAGGGGGSSEDGAGDGPGGFGGFFAGGDAPGDWNGQSNANNPGTGATQFAGGQNQTATNTWGEFGSFGQGGSAHQDGSAFAYASGGGGGGWYGGGAAGPPTGNGLSGSAGSGGGGSGWIDPDSGYSDLEIEDGANSAGNGYVEFRWEDPA